jgi:hypothetical protein
MPFALALPLQLALYSNRASADGSMVLNVPRSTKAD